MIEAMEGRDFLVRQLARGLVTWLTARPVGIVSPTPTPTPTPTTDTKPGTTPTLHTTQRPAVAGWYRMRFDLPWNPSGVPTLQDADRGVDVKNNTSG